jgi:hypothetical protein
MALYYAQTGLGTLEPLGECSDIEEADEKAHEAGLDAIWLWNHETLIQHKNRINNLLETT